VDFNHIGKVILKVLYYLICLNWVIYLINIICVMLVNNLNISTRDNFFPLLIMLGTHIISVLVLLVSLPIYIFNIISGNTDLKNYYRKNTILSFIHCVFIYVTVFVVIVPEQI
jgi:hypothetical protein